MKWGKGFSPFEEPSSQPAEVETFGLIGIVPEQVLELRELFSRAGLPELTKVLREEAGHPWAARTLQDLWEEGESDARQRALFDVIWHRRALQVDPMVTAPGFAGFDVLMEVARAVAPDVAALLDYIDGGNTRNDRRNSGPEWWKAWHGASETRPGGWLTREEARELTQGWSALATPEFELACLEAMGTTYTHSGCWALLTNLGGFFAQCASEQRSVVCEIDS